MSETEKSGRPVEPETRACPLATSWTDTELAYFAGFIDGEGSFVLHHRKGSHVYSCQLQVGNTDARVLEWIQTRFGGSVNLERRNNPKHKLVYRWISEANSLSDVITALLPYLVVKKDQAELILAYRRTLPQVVKTHRSTYDTPNHVKDERHRIHGKLAMLNRRGA